jgi:hypothetical protein
MTRPLSPTIGVCERIWFCCARSLKPKSSEKGGYRGETINSDFSESSIATSISP